MADLKTTVKAVTEHLVYRFKAMNLETRELDKKELNESIKSKLDELVEEFESGLSKVDINED